MPLILSKEPAAGDPVLKEQFAQQLQNLGSEVVLRLPQGVEPQYSFNVELLEASDNSWQAFPGLIDRCDMSIVLAILFQNLTTEVTEGSFAAARVHSDVRQSALAADNRSLSHTIYTQIARPFAAINFGDASLAPTTEWDIEPVEDRNAEGDLFNKFALSLESLTKSGIRVEDPEALAWELFGMRLKPGKMTPSPTKESNVFAYHLDYGIATKNEVRARLDLPPVDGGDKPAEKVQGADTTSPGEAITTPKP